MSQACLRMRCASLCRSSGCPGPRASTQSPVCLPRDKAVLVGTDPGARRELTPPARHSSPSTDTLLKEGLLSAGYADADRQVETLFNFYMKNISTVQFFFKDFFVHEEKSTCTQPNSYTKLAVLRARCHPHPCAPGELLSRFLKQEKTHVNKEWG